MMAVNYAELALNELENGAADHSDYVTGLR
jgi:hypothetical protein